MYAVTRNGERFLVNARAQNAVTPTPLIAVVNWTSTLQKSLDVACGGTLRVLEE